LANDRLGGRIREADQLIGQNDDAGQLGVAQGQLIERQGRNRLGLAFPDPGGRRACGLTRNLDVEGNATKAGNATDDGLRPQEYFS
jgi:hypothetical protein